MNMYIGELILLYAYHVWCSLVCLIFRMFAII